MVLGANTSGNWYSRLLFSFKIADCTRGPKATLAGSVRQTEALGNLEGGKADCRAHTRNLKIGRPSMKLSERYIGPFTIADAVGPVAFRLDLPPSMRIHNVFHSSLLRAAATDPFPSQEQPNQPRVRLE
jgi:hypothetical protein